MNNNDRTMIFGLGFMICATMVGENGLAVFTGSIAVFSLIFNLIWNEE